MPCNDLPDIMYFGAPQRIKELKNRVFLTPHIGIASLFIIDKNKVQQFTNEYNFNIGYRQWTFSNDQLKAPLNEVNMLHNIPKFENKVFAGEASGYIYEVDIRDVKNKLSLFVTNDPNREVIYNGQESFPIVRCIPHNLWWDFKFDLEEVKKHGVAEKS